MFSKTEFSYYFFLFFSLILIFSFKIIHISLNKVELFENVDNKKKFKLLRRDIVDRNGILISRNVQTFHAAINPNFIKNKNNFLIKLKLTFPDLPYKKIEKKIYTLNKTLLLKEKDYNESQLDFFYLTSPSNIEKKIAHLDNYDYLPMKYSQIFSSMSSFLDLKNRLAVHENYNDKEKKK